MTGVGNLLSHEAIASSSPGSTMLPPSPTPTLRPVFNQTGPLASHIATATLRTYHHDDKAGCVADKDSQLQEHLCHADVGATLFPDYHRL